MRKTVYVFVLCWLSAACLQAGYVPINLSAVANTTPVAMGLLNGNLYPSGSVTYGGVPFMAGPTWSADVAAGGALNQGTEQVLIPINVFGVSTLYTLMNSQWGETPGTFLNFILAFGDGSTYTVGLVADQAIRDYNNFTWTNTISGAWAAPMGMVDSTVNAWNDNGMPCAPSGTCSIQNGNYQRLDEQTINIPLIFQSLNLVSLTVVDSGNHATVQDALDPNPNDAQRSFITGLTVNTPIQTPEPGTMALLFGGVAAILALRKRPAA